ncbi:MAG TPA: type II toxin-antitoxin system PemK/MazF family toxin [Gemmataceae bacterium]|nr:type II toxin-antitoxin system PemK/MazF family toxin [Gemmataceae bacterium]
MPNPGDVVIAPFPGAVKTKPRPVVIVSTILYHSVRPDLILALLTTDIANSTKPTDYVLQDWAAAGLHYPTAFRAFLFTLPAVLVSDVKGQLSAGDWQEVQARLRLALAVT